MLSDVAVQDSSAVMGDHEEAIQDTEGDCWNSEEVHRSDDFAVIVKEGLPTSSWFWVLRNFGCCSNHRGKASQ
jgi:hypothetical protein